jgi:hypothetical protein
MKITLNNFGRKHPIYNGFRANIMINDNGYSVVINLSEDDFVGVNETKEVELTVLSDKFKGSLDEFYLFAGRKKIGFCKKI